MNNETRRVLLARQRQSGFPGSIIDVFKAYDAGRDIISEFEQQQQQPQIASTPEQQQEGLRPQHAAGNTQASMTFPNVPPNTAFNTVGMKAPINIEKYDKQGHLVKSYESVPPGVENLPMGPNEGMVLETPAEQYKTGGEIKKYQKAGFIEPPMPTTAVAESTAQPNFAEQAFLNQTNAPPPQAMPPRDRFAEAGTIKPGYQGAPPNAMAFMPPGLQGNSQAAGKYIEENPLSNPLSLTAMGAATVLDPGVVGMGINAAKNIYKLNPFAFKPNPKAGYRMIGGDDGLMDVLKFGEVRPKGHYEYAHFNIGKPLNPNRMSPRELLAAGHPGGYRGPYMAEMKNSEWKSFIDDAPEWMRASLKELNKDKDVWYDPLLGHIKSDDPRLTIYKEHWLKGYSPVKIKQAGGEIESYQSGGEVKKYQKAGFITAQDNTRTNISLPERIEEELLNQDEYNPGKITQSNSFLDRIGAYNPQTFDIPEINPKTGETVNHEYQTSFMNEISRSGLEPTFTFTSAGGPGGGARLYFPYSDPLGVGLEMDVDPTGPGAGLLINTGKIRQAGNWAADKLGTEKLRDMNLPPGFAYVGAEMAGNAVSPFIGATVSAGDTEHLQDWVDRPENSGTKTFSRAFMKGMGPGLHAWNMPSSLSGKFTVHNPMNVMGDPLWQSPDIFRGRRFHNPISGTGVGIGGRTGIRGGNIVPHLELGPLEQGFRGGFAAIKDEVAEIADELMAKNKSLTRSAAMKEAYNSVAGNVNLGKALEKSRIPKLLDHAGEFIYGTSGAAKYDKEGRTLANSLRNAKIPYGKLLNHPWLWKSISRGLMAPDAFNFGASLKHSPGEPVLDAWEPVFGKDPNAERMRKYGRLPRTQLFVREGIDPIFGHKWWNSSEENDAEKQRNRFPIIEDLRSQKEHQGKTWKELQTLADKIILERSNLEINKTRASDPTSLGSGYSGYTLQSGGPIKRLRKRKARHLRDDMGYQENPDGSRSTHLMMSGDNYAWPSIYPTSPGNYEEQTFDEALERGEMFEFKNEKQADRFARGSWKTPRWDDHYDMRRAQRRQDQGYDVYNEQTQHWSSVDPKTSKFLKDSRHPSVQKEIDWFNSPEGAEFKSTHNLKTKNFLGKNRKYYKYVDKKQYGGEADSDTIVRDLRGSPIPSYMQAVQYPKATTVPIQLSPPTSTDKIEPTDEVLNYDVLEKYMAKNKGGTKELWKAVADTIAFHESGPWMRNDPKAKQRGGGPGRGLHQFESTHSRSFQTAQQRHRNLARMLNMPVDSAIINAKYASELTADQQRTLFQGNLLESKAKLADYASGKMTLEDLWLKGHKRIESSGNREAFRVSVAKMKTE